MANVLLILELVQTKKELLHAEVNRSQLASLNCKRKRHMYEPNSKGIAIFSFQAEAEWHEESLWQSHLCFEPSPHKVKLIVALGWRIKWQAEIYPSFR
jgi:methylase of polypeptide subunit release factors